MDREKFQQKALKQTKQKKSKSAEFLMVKEDREAMEGIGNPAFNMSSLDLSAYQTSKKKVIRHDVLDHTLAAHQRKFRLPDPAEPQGNEYRRNYFDPLMDEEINPRQCRMEVSREAPLQADNRSLYNDQLMRLFDENGCRGAQGESTEKESSSSEELMHLSKNLELHKDGSEATSACNEEFKRYAQKDIIWLGNSSLKQVEQSQSPQPLQIQMKCVRGLKNKAPQGSYLIKVSLLSQPGGCVLQWWQTAQLKITTCPVRHDGNFYDVGLYFHENLYVVLPPKKDVKPDMAFLFELFLLRGKYACCDCVVGWSAFPLCDNNFDVVEGKFKCPLLQGHYDQKLNNFRKIEDLICLDLNNWLCNLYFQVIKLPVCLNDQKTHVRHIQLTPEFPVCLKAEAGNTESGVESTTGLSGKEKEKSICASVNNNVKSSLHSPQGNIFNKIDSCPMDCDLTLLKEDQELNNKGESLTDHSVKAKTAAWRTGEIKDYSQDISYLEELEKHRFSVCCAEAC
ncbi:uncharacterized protein LOC123820735 [Phyllostomus hastatus]|uniref:uncharacterized protein LOC123820735 n=1 Tax=Phyllostomus hastatus TaxID=9423 RepID=UPI001E68298C|nr:uncharacterized protein LOC123820735 [Phyllostomus hastatus]